MFCDHLCAQVPGLCLNNWEGSLGWSQGRRVSLDSQHYLTWTLEPGDDILGLGFQVTCPLEQEQPHSKASAPPQSPRRH